MSHDVARNPCQASASQPSMKLIPQFILGSAYVGQHDMKKHSNTIGLLYQATIALRIMAKTSLTVFLTDYKNQAQLH
jgi:hypothetical protein